jgi:methionine synthase II (cobalamin-independent)
MNQGFCPDCRFLLIGSFPVNDHQEAGRLVMNHSPEIPVWAQLPFYRIEGMIPQFLNGMPGLCEENGKTFIHTQSGGFEEGLVSFYEQYFEVTEGRRDINASIFALTSREAKGFFVLLKNLTNLSAVPFAVKGQITGPFTFCTGVTDQDKRAIFYNDQVRDAAVKLLSLKAVWQIQQLAAFHAPVIIFIDEPALTGFGSSEFTTISRQDVTSCLEEVISAIHWAGGLAGIHVCGNTDWSLILDSSVDIVNFDAHAYFDRFVLYGGNLRQYMNAGGVLAWGIVPTLDPETIDRETADSLTEKLKDQMEQLNTIGIEKQRIFAQSLITPSCGLGPLDVERAEKVLRLTRDISRHLRNNH